MTTELKTVPGLESDATVRLAFDLIKRPSITPDDAGCQKLISARLAAAGFRCEPMLFGDVTNLWARYGDRSPLLCFAGHTDVVPPGDAAGWSAGPFEPTIRDGLLYGRGSADMKCGVAAMVTAAERFVAANPEFKGSLAFLITSDEEGAATEGTLKVIETLQARNELIDWCIVGEPSSESQLGDTIRIGRRGSLTGTLKVNGTEGHVAYGHLANNPIRSFSPVLAELHETVWDEGNEQFPPTTFEMVHLKSSSGVSNVIPASLTAIFNLRYSTEWDHSGLRSKVAEILDKHDVDYRLDWHLSGEPFLTAPGRLTDAVLQAVTDTVKIEPMLSTGGGTSDGRYISPAGADVIELGVINATIHKVDEHVNVKDVPVLSRIYERIMERLLLA